MASTRPLPTTHLDAAITLAFCWAHLRRRFFDVVQDGPAPIASEALARIAALYAIEKTIRGRSADERCVVRQERSNPSCWRSRPGSSCSSPTSPKAKIAEHIPYALNHWDGLTQFLDDGRIDQGAENWACIASLIETCKLCGIEPQAYLTDLLTKLVNLWPASRVDELMPWAWAAERGRSLAA